MRNINATLLDSHRTAIFVAHRLRTISNCDVIFVLQDGKVSEQGTHEQLFAREESLYRDLWDSQSTIGIGHGAGQGEHLPEGGETAEHEQTSSEQAAAKQ